MKIYSAPVVVKTTAVPLYTFTPSELLSVALRAEAEIEIGVAGVVVGGGYVIPAAGSFGFGKDDVDLDDHGLVRMYAVAPVECVCEVFAFTRGR